MAERFGSIVSPRSRSKFLVELLRRELERESDSLVEAAKRLTAFEAKEPVESLEETAWSNASLVEDGEPFDAAEFQRQFPIERRGEHQLSRSVDAAVELLAHVGDEVGLAQVAPGLVGQSLGHLGVVQVLQHRRDVAEGFVEGGYFESGGTHVGGPEAVQRSVAGSAFVAHDLTGSGRVDRLVGLGVGEDAEMNAGHHELAVVRKGHRVEERRWARPCGRRRKSTAGWSRKVRP